LGEGGEDFLLPRDAEEGGGEVGHEVVVGGGRVC
jgi:hypothetical protein